ncbi:MAG: hypothetical protein QOF79_40 [Actinomycetota bacterium]|nr:hypothetical protein [Actinomycetota bacterium]
MGIATFREPPVPIATARSRSSRMQWPGSVLLALPGLRVAVSSVDDRWVMASNVDAKCTVMARAAAPIFSHGAAEGADFP